MYLYFQTHIITSFEAHSFQRAAMLSSDTRFYCLITIVALPPPALFSLVGIFYSYGPWLGTRHKVSFLCLKSYKNSPKMRASRATAMRADGALHIRGLVLTPWTSHTP